MAAADRIAATAQIDSSYLPGGAKVKPHLMHHGIGSSVFAGLKVVTNRHIHRHREIARPTPFVAKGRI